MQRSARRRKSNDKTWQQTKSENTRATILDAALECFYDLSYAGTTTDQIARKAGVSRGAMLHHFPSRFDLIRGAVAHLNAKRLALFERQESRIQRGAEHTRVAEGIDSYWKQLNSKLFVVFHELQVAARTDGELRKVLIPAITEFDARWLEMVERIFPDLTHSKNFHLGNFLTLFLLEGLAVNQFTRHPGKWTGIVLDDLKSRLADELYADVRVDRRTAPRRRGAGDRAATGAMKATTRGR